MNMLHAAGNESRRKSSPEHAGSAAAPDQSGEKSTETPLFLGSAGAKLQGYLLARPGTRPPRSVALMVHGMAEHARRYRETAERLSELGACIYAYDQRGHGETALRDGSLGFVAETEGFRLLVDDLVCVIDRLRVQHPGLPFVLLGQSMGTLVIRDYMQRYADHAARLHAVVLSGAVGDPGIAGRVGLWYARRLCRQRGADAPAQELDTLTFGSYGRRFRPLRTPFDWLSRDAEAVAAYVNDPLCGFVCSTSFYVELFRAALRVHCRRAVRHMPAAVPCLFIAGSADPVGGFGRKVTRAALRCRRAGMRAVTARLYPEARHELYHESNRQEVWADLLHWLSQTPSVVA